MGAASQPHPTLILPFPPRSEGDQSPLSRSRLVAALRPRSVVDSMAKIAIRQPRSGNLLKNKLHKLRSVGTLESDTHPGAASRSWHAPIIADSRASADTVSTARAGSIILGCLFSPTRFHEEPFFLVFSRESQGVPGLRLKYGFLPRWSQVQSSRRKSVVNPG